LNLTEESAIVAFFRAGGAPDEAASPIVDLTPDRAATIRLGLTSRFDRQHLINHVRRFPGYGFCTQNGKQFAIAGRWRRRAEIAELVEATRGDRREELIEALIRSLTAQGVRLVVLDYGLEALDPSFFRQVGFNLVERIVEYERSSASIVARPRPDLTVRLYRAADRDAILDLERVSFDWLWWNSADEWDAYVATPAVEVLVGSVDGRIIGYAGMTVYRRDGHLDRLAVREDEQGRGYGSGLLTEALLRMDVRGARRVGLTTQEHNARSQTLYEHYGFHRGRWTYSIHGRWLNPEDLTS